jgi:hypothetical protein
MTCTMARGFLSLNDSLSLLRLFIAGWRGAAVYPNDVINYCRRDYGR